MLGKVSAASSRDPRERGSQATPPTSSKPVAERAVFTLEDEDGAKAEADPARAAMRATVSLTMIKGLRGVGGLTTGFYARNARQVAREGARKGTSSD